MNCLFNNCCIRPATAEETGQYPPPSNMCMQSPIDLTLATAPPPRQPTAPPPPSPKCLVRDEDDDSFLATNAFSSPLPSPGRVNAHDEANLERVAIAPAPPPSPITKLAKPSFNTFDRRDAFIVTDGDGTEFKIRSPGYAITKHKQPSETHVYTTVAARMMQSDGPDVQALEPRFSLPPLADEEVQNDTGLPRRLILSFIVPAEPPHFFTNPTTTKCNHMIIVCSQTVENLTEWKNSGSADVALFQKFLQDTNDTSQTAPRTNGRVKILHHVDNMSAISGGRWMHRFNGIPMLCTKSCSVFHGDDCLEICVNACAFSLSTRMWLLPAQRMLEQVVLHASITLEGRSENELPERVLFAARLSGFDLSNLATIPPLPPSCSSELKI